MQKKIKNILKKILRIIPTYNIQSVSRIRLNIELRRLFKRLKPGKILDVGSKESPYKKYLPCLQYMRLDIDKNTNPDICCDIHHIQFQSDYFDIVIATEVLEHLHEPQQAVNEIKRVLKPGGTCILSTKFIHQYHPDPGDYFRFTWDSLNYFFRTFSHLEVHHYGNRVQVLWQVINSGKIRKIFGIFLNIFNPLIARLHSKNTTFPLGFVVYAQK
jgi:SAM-dependent methyltransferase